MEAIAGWLDGLTLWHWVGIGIVLLTLEVAVGTFDLLWVAMAAFATAVFTLLAPDPWGGWQGQLIWFAAMAIVLLLMGRTLFRGLRMRSTSHPTLNDRTAGLVGKRGEAATMFDNRRGRVKIGDTIWLAAQGDDTVIVEGDEVVVEGSDGTTLRVRLV
ncbi:MAG: NfeD family protein [Alphaproteobacteria bacterium]|nr:NfeD family protein [Alphaproteobacteria bacterium]